MVYEELGGIKTIFERSAMLGPRSACEDLSALLICLGVGRWPLKVLLRLVCRDESSPDTVNAQGEGYRKAC
jgi:hypothetical protein